jgi:hypothetical protein
VEVAGSGGGVAVAVIIIVRPLCLVSRGFVGPGRKIRMSVLQPIINNRDSYTFSYILNFKIKIFLK